MAVSSKKSGTYKGKSLKPGGGGRFQKCLDSGKTRAQCAAAGRAKYGAKQMSKWASAGRKRAAKKKA
jgi:hypothetical protein